MLQGGRASDAVPSAVSADGDAVHAWLDRRGATKVSVVDGAGDSAMDETLNAVKVAVVTGSTANTEYTEGSTVANIIGQAMLFEGASDVVRVPSATNPFPVTVISGAATGVEYTEGAVAPTITVKAIGWEDTGDTLRPVSAAKPLPVNIVSSLGGSVLPDPVVTSAAVAVPIKFVSVNATADGDNTIISAVASKKLRILGYRLTSTGAGTIQLKTGGGGVLDRFISTANGSGSSYAGGVDAPAQETVSGEALLLNNPAGVDTVGHLTYIEI